MLRVFVVSKDSDKNRINVLKLVGSESYNRQPKKMVDFLYSN